MGVVGDQFGLDRVASALAEPVQRQPVAGLEQHRARMPELAEVLASPKPQERLLGDVLGVGLGLQNPVQIDAQPIVIVAVEGGQSAWLAALSDRAASRLPSFSEVPFTSTSSPRRIFVFDPRVL